MPTTVGELIGVPHLRLRLFAGSGGTDREIRWAHASELPDPSEWLEPGALVMTTGLGLPVEPEAQGAYVQRLARAGLGGLLIGEQADERIYAPELTPCLAAAADERSFPVLLMPYELPFADVARVVAEANHGEERRGYLRLAAKGRMTEQELDEEIAALEETRSAAERELASLRARSERLEQMERDRDAMLEHYAALAPEALDSLTSEERHQLYKMLGLKVWVAKNGDVEIEMAGVPVSGSDGYSATSEVTPASAPTAAR